MAIQPPARIALLEHAYSPEVFEPQRHFVAYPVQSGLQACLIEEKQPNGTFRIVDALTMVPDDVRHSTPNQHQVYACWLGVIASFYKADIAALKDSARVQTLKKRTEYQPPFRSGRLHALAQAVQRLADEWSSGQQTKPIAVSHGTWDEYKAGLMAADCWHTQHLKVGEAAKTCVDQWRILGLWQSWEKRQLSWRERAGEYQRRYPQRVQPGKLQGRTKAASLDPEAFEKRCRHIGLRKGKEPKKRHKPAAKSRLISPRTVWARTNKQP